MSYERAWRVESDNTDEYGVLVECGPPEHPYWWVLCPASATLHLDDSKDVVGCQDASCMWDDVHRNANAVWRSLKNERLRRRVGYPPKDAPKMKTETGEYG